MTKQINAQQQESRKSKRQDSAGQVMAARPGMPSGDGTLGGGWPARTSSRCRADAWEGGVQLGNDASDVRNGARRQQEGERMACGQQPAKFAVPVSLLERGLFEGIPCSNCSQNYQRRVGIRIRIAA